MRPETVGEVIPIDILIEKFGQLPPWIHLMPIIIIVVGIGIGYLLRGLFTRAHQAIETGKIQQTLEQARIDVQNMLRQAEIDAQNEVLKARERFESESLQRRNELSTAETRLQSREAALDRRAAAVDQKETALAEHERKIHERQEFLEKREMDLGVLEQSAIVRLHEVAGLSREEARRTLMNQLQEELAAEAARLIRRQQDEARATARESARELILAAAERFAATQVSEVTTSAVALPNEEMKGRIIGREGRNIRSLEAATGCNILIDDTPQTIVISGFDPLRREVARRTLEKLISDGRINPARIEEVIEEVRKDLDEAIRQAGESAVAELRLEGVNAEIIQVLGALKFRHSFAQNVLQHSIEVAHLMGMMAADLGLDAGLARRVGLFHDLGKALEHTAGGGHALAGAAFLKRNGEADLVCEAVGAHHRDTASDNVYTTLLIVADALTAARPGARSESPELYLQRLAQLEGLAAKFAGVRSAYALQAGRELRVFVIPEEVDDAHALTLARDIARRVEDEVQYPGQVKVTIVRETRCTEYAR